MRRIIVLVAAVVAALVLSVPALAATGWTKPSVVWNARYRSPSMVVDAHGHVHMAVSSDSGIWYLTDASGGWRRIRISDNGSDPQIALDPWDHSLTVVYVVDSGDCCPGSSGLWYVTNRHPAGPGAWRKPRGIPDGGGPYTNQPSVVVRHGVIAVAASVGLYDATEVEFLTNASGHWTHRAIRPAGTHWAWQPSLELDRQGRPVIAYQVHGSEMPLTTIRLARGSTRIGGFTTERVARLEEAGEPSLALDTKDRPRITFDAADGTHYVKRTSKGWRVDLVWRGGDASELVLDRSGVPRIVGARPTGVWYAEPLMWSWFRTHLDGDHRPVEVIALAIHRKSGTVHVAYAADDRVWYTHTK